MNYFLVAKIQPSIDFLYRKAMSAVPYSIYVSEEHPEIYQVGLQKQDQPLKPWKPLGGLAHFSWENLKSPLWPTDCLCQPKAQEVVLGPKELMQNSLSQIRTLTFHSYLLIQMGDGVSAHVNIHRSSCI